MVMKFPGFVHKLYSKLRFFAYQLFPEMTLKVEFRRRTGYTLNLDTPKTFNEKLQWLKLNWYDPRASICADKYAVREYVKNKGLSNILNKLYSVYDNVDDIDFKKLSEEFVMKVTHGCGQNLICHNKKDICWEKEKIKFKNV